MSVDYYVAVHAADWPTPATLNQCVRELQYPIAITTAPAMGMDKPLTEVPGTAGLVVTFEGAQVELEASVTKLGPESPYAFGLRADIPKLEGTLPDGSGIIIQELQGAESFVPKDLNDDLRELGVQSPDYKDGDYVLTLSFRSSVIEYRAGWFLMAGLIKCTNGLGFEFQGPSFGGIEFADALARQAADLEYWK